MSLQPLRGDYDKTKTRGRNWSTEEDEALCLAWLNISQDPISGTGQKLDTLYSRVFSLFIELCTERGYYNAELRGVTGVKHRWLLISRACSKFAGCVTQVLTKQQSGASSSDFMKQALILYKTATKSPFVLLHAFKILENAPKWQVYMHNKNKNCSESPKNVNEGSGKENSCPLTNTSRPMGLKRSKNSGKVDSVANAAVQLAQASDKIAEIAKKKIELGLQKTHAFNRMVDHSIMSVDFSKLSAVARTYYRREQARILAEVMKHGVEHNNRSSELASDEESLNPIELLETDEEDDSNSNPQRKKLRQETERNLSDFVEDADGVPSDIDGLDDSNPIEFLEEASD
ncbi:uncharacterized protein LOC129760819 [Uranotaenia lowii]|uniref:uncharacterized protein LOC129760819 n=1 Tax=Uranotaenia lowii TaxID=190385 RepID=UPI00247B1A61|nr:uncharacterized protein LOC129760819 [Uranotaenia lowii]